MFVFTVRDMYISGQAVAVVAAVKRIDEDASVLVNLSVHEVAIVPAIAGATELSDAIIHAGFDPVLRGSSGQLVEGRRQAPMKIPFVGFDHDFSTSSAGALGDEARINASL